MDQERPISDSIERLQPTATNERFYPDMGHVGYPWAITFLLCGMVLLLAGFIMTVTFDATQFKVFLALGTIMILGGIANFPLQQKRVAQDEIVQQDAEANSRRAWAWPWPWPLAAICFLGSILLLSGLVLVITKHCLPLLPIEKSKALNRSNEIRTHLTLNTWPAFLIMGGIVLLGGIVSVRKHKKLSNDSSAHLPTLAEPTLNPSPATTAPLLHRPRSRSHSRFSCPSASHDDPSTSVPATPNTHMMPATSRDSTLVAFAAGAVSFASDDSSPPPYVVGPILLPPSSSDAPPSYNAVVRQQSQALPTYDAFFVPSPKTEDDTGESNALGYHNQVLPTYEEATLGLSPK